ncbi:hypothetical protein QYF36_021223 [Acer negundo]|nr:hypothetical protein QYF36_021223 [Acer negundo]
MAIGSLENIVATRTIIKMKSLLFLVFVDVVINEDAMLPIPNEVEGLLYVKDALGYHILWPKEPIVDDSINVFNGKEMYTQDEIDKVRLEWIEHIKPFVK